MRHCHKCHSGFLAKVFCILTCISAEATVLLTTSQARSRELGPYAIPFSQVWLAAKAGRRLCVTRQSLHKNLALGDRGLGLNSQIVPSLSVCKLNLYSDLFGQTSINAPEEVAEAGKQGGRVSGELLSHLQLI